MSIDQVATRIAGEFMGSPVSVAKIHRLVSEAILAERERCAKVATDYGLSRKIAFGGPLEAKREAAQDIASAIRSGEETR